MDQLMTVKELATHLRISVITVKRRVAARQWPHTQIAGQTRFTEKHVQEIVAAGEQPVARARRRVA